METRLIHRRSEELMAAFRIVCREGREERHMRRCDLAERAALSAQMVTYLEEAERLPSLSSLARLALAMDMRPSELVARLEERIGLHTDAACVQPWGDRDAG